MQELNQFCHKYLPQHFVSKYKDCKLKEYFFDYKNPVNVFQLTGKNFSLIDKLLSANPDLEAAKIIDQYFIFTIMEFKKFRKEIKEIAEKNGEMCLARQTIRLILKSMQQNDRTCFQLFARIAYFYFESRENKDKKSTVKKQVEEKKRKYEDYFDQILTTYMDIKFLTMTEDDSFNPAGFMEYCINIFLDLNPNDIFFGIVIKIINECQLDETHRNQIIEKIGNMTKKQLAYEIKNSENQQKAKIQSQTTQNSILEPKNENVSCENSNRPNESTPVKERSTSKSERNTHETSQKKLNVIQKKEDSKKEDTNSLDVLKMTLQHQMNKKISYKERTLYSRKTYLMPKKTININDQVSSTGSNPTNSNEELFLIDFNKSFSARCLKVHFDEGEDFLAGATPKPKKKVKMEKNYTGIFDENGNFIPRF